MQTVFIPSMSYLRRWIVAGCALVAVSAAVTPGAADTPGAAAETAGAAAGTPGAATPKSCSKELKDYGPEIDKNPFPSAVSSPTTFLPAGGIGEIVFREPIGTPPTIFRVFRVRGDQKGATTSSPVDILSVEKAREKSEAGAVAGFNPNDSVLLRIRIDDDGKFYWERQYFIVVACADGKVVHWGSFAPLVSPSSTPLWICLAALLVSYLFSLFAVWLSRRKPHPLASQYPAVFGARPLRRWDFLNPVHLTADVFNRANVQKLQVLLFSFLVGFLVLDLVLRTGALADLSLTVVTLLGISGVGAAAAQITNREKSRLSFDNWAWLQQRQVLQIPDPATGPGPQWRDLVLTNREFDIYKLQTLIFSFAVAVALISAGASSLSTFTVPATLLGILGLSQVVYVGGILVRPPAIDELDQALTKLRAAGETVAAAKAQNTDTDAEGKLLPKKPEGQTEPAINAQRQYDDLAKKVIPMLESALEVKADPTKL